MAEKIGCLESLRGLAAFAVVLHHFAIFFYPALYDGVAAHSHTANNLEAAVLGTPVNVVYNGNFAVCIFFVLSAFVLSYRFFKTRDTEVLASGAVRRYPRLFIPILFSVLMAYVLMKLSLFYNAEAAKLTLSPWLPAYWNFTPTLYDALYQSVYGIIFNNNYAWNTVLWTMTYEFMGSFIVFGFLALFGKARNRWVFYLIGIYFTLNTYYMAFFLGLAICDLYNNFNVLFEWASRPWATVILIAVGLFIGSYPMAHASIHSTIYGPLYFGDFSYLYYHIIGASLVVVSILSSERLRSALSNKNLLFLGKISFSLYLTHFLVLGSISCFLFIGLLRYLPYGYAFLVTFCVSMAAIFPIAIAMDRYVDEKGILLSKHIYDRYFSDRVSKAIKESPQVAVSGES